MYNYKYPRASLTVDAIVIKKQSLELLLIQRKNMPFVGKWALPGGFVDMDELLVDGCVRELKEETGLVLTRMTQFKTYDAINRDPRGRTISIVYYGFAEENAEVQAADDAMQARWFSIKKLPELAFDHEQIISDFIESIDILT